MCVNAKQLISFKKTKNYCLLGTILVYKYNPTTMIGQ